MAATTVFDRVAEALEQETDFDRLAARGTLRLALRAGGLDPQAGAAEIVEVVERLMPEELRTRGVEDPERICQRLRLVALGHAGGPPPPDRSREEP